MGQRSIKIGIVFLALFGGALPVRAANRSTLPNFPRLAESIKFFEQSIRRDISSAEEMSMSPRLRNARAEASCGSTFLENSAGRYIVLSAKHCVGDDDFLRLCRRGEIEITTSTGERATCTRPIHAAHGHDVALFEVTFSVAPRNITTAQISIRPPALGTRLSARGYPGDPRRNRQPTVSENCWVRSAPLNPHPDPESAGDTEVRMLMMAPLHEWIAHNCSIFSGNSGGGFFNEGTRELVGIASLSPVVNAYRFSGANSDPDQILFLRRYVEANRAVFEREGITILEGSSRQSGAIAAPYDYLEASLGKTFRLSQEAENWCAVTLRSLNRETGMLLVELRSRIPMDRSVFPQACDRNLTLRCLPAPSRVCTNLSSNFSIQEFGPQGLRVVSRLDSPPANEQVTAELVDPAALPKPSYALLITMRAQARTSPEFVRFSLGALELAGSPGEMLRAITPSIPNASAALRGPLMAAAFEHRRKFLDMNPSASELLSYRTRIEPGISEITFLGDAIPRVRRARDFLDLTAAPSNVEEMRRHLLGLFRLANFDLFLALGPSEEELREFRETTAALSEDQLLRITRAEMAPQRARPPERPINPAIAVDAAEVMREHLARFNENLRQACQKLGFPR